MRIRSLLDVMLALAAATACTRPSVATVAPSESIGSLELVVAATTDIHGRVRGWNYDLNAADSAVGLARAANIVDSLRGATGDRVVLVDAGDIIQGNALSFVAARVSAADTPHPVMAAMNAMRYDAAAVGNHEFNYGVPFLERTASQARFPLLAANARRPDGSRAFRGWTIVERGGVKVGIVGATTPGSMVWDRDNLRGRVVVGDILPAVREAVGEARRAGAQVVVVTMHSGLAEPATYDTVATGLPSDNVAARVARDVPGIDLIAYGHSHKEMADTTINGVLLMQAKNWVQSVAVANVRLLRGGSGWRVASKSSRLVRTAGHAEAPAVLAATESAHRATVAWVTTPIGRTDVVWRADSARVVDRLRGDHRGSDAGTVPVRQHPPRRADHWSAASRISRAECAILPHRRQWNPVGEPGRSRLQLRRGGRRRLPARSLEAGGAARDASRGARRPGHAHGQLHPRAHQLSPDRGR